MKSQGRSCEGKVPFTRADAIDMLNTMRKRSERANTGNHKHSMAVYKCAFCPHFHLGHNAPAKGKVYRRTKPIRDYLIIESED